MNAEMKTTLKALAFVIAIAAILVLAKNSIGEKLGISTPLVVVEGYSMLPTLYNGDIVIVYKPSPYDIKVGDILVYHSLRGELVIHRVIKINSGPGCKPLCYVTKGDNNPVDDVALMLQPHLGISYDEVVGIVYQIDLDINGKNIVAPFRIPYLGLLSFIAR
ncbi:MAG TPA: signal peptidase I [Pyrodictium delaneyi]|uniref:Signal peptidase I n=1 Tax=Pyrodictium delaneyi TaxID=1273541 RepID=A0A832ZWD0_9CREN|nr:signal peptidase I [Pyrodictium delaneyi]